MTPAERERHGRIKTAIGRGVQFLVQSQSADGSWGKGQMADGFVILLSRVPGSHDAFRVGTTALCVMALREAGERTAHDKAVRYLVEHGEARRDDGDVLYNTWAHIYVIEALAREMRHNPDPRLRKAIEWNIDRLGRYETFVGGWGYYDFEVGAQRPGGGATSFETAAGLVALWEARRAGVDVPQKLVERALKLLEDLRLPDDAYLYGYNYRYIPLLDANQPRGSVGRNQPCNYALWLWGRPVVGEAQVLSGLRLFETEHAFIEMGRKRPFPHSSWYQTAPYYYYYDHYYAARLIEKLGGVEKRRYGAMIADWLLPLQEADGSWWDFAMWDYHRPYGTAFAVMTLLRCR